MWERGRQSVQIKWPCKQEMKQISKLPDLQVNSTFRPHPRLRRFFFCQRKITPFLMRLRLSASRMQYISSLNSRQNCCNRKKISAKKRAHTHQPNENVFSLSIRPKINCRTPKSLVAFQVESMQKKTDFLGNRGSKCIFSCAATLHLNTSTQTMQTFTELSMHHLFNWPKTCSREINLQRNSPGVRLHTQNGSDCAFLILCYAVGKSFESTLGIIATDSHRLAIFCCSAAGERHRETKKNSKMNRSSARVLINTKPASVVFITYRCMQLFSYRSSNENRTRFLNRISCEREKIARLPVEIWCSGPSEDNAGTLLHLKNQLIGAAKINGTPFSGSCDKICLSKSASEMTNIRCYHFPFIACKVH